jgi:hypothetical protein
MVSVNHYSQSGRRISDRGTGRRRAFSEIRRGRRLCTEATGPHGERSGPGRRYQLPGRRAKDRRPDSDRRRRQKNLHGSDHPRETDRPTRYCNRGQSLSDGGRRELAEPNQNVQNSKQMRYGTVVFCLSH